jgi:hypothetical protein
VVDRRVLIALTVAALGFFSTDALNSPYNRPWKWGREDASDHARHEAADSFPKSTAVRASATMLPLLAERRRVYALSGLADANAATASVDRVIVTQQDVGWTPEEWRLFGAGMSRKQFVMIYDRDGVKIYTRLSST